MARKTLNQILKQNTFTGADVGKARLLTLIGRFKGKEGGLTDQDIEQMARSIQTQSQAAIYKAYLTFGLYLENFYSFQTGFKEMYYHGIEHLMLCLYSVFKKVQKLREYLADPLTITEEEYTTYREKARKQFYSRKLDLEELIRISLTDSLVNLWEGEGTNDIQEDLRPIAEVYARELVEIQPQNGEFKMADPKDIIARYAELHHVYNDMETLKDFVLKRLPDDEETQKGVRRDLAELANDPEELLAHLIMREYRPIMEGHYSAIIKEYCDLATKDHNKLKPSFYKELEGKLKEMGKKEKELENLFKADNREKKSKYIHLLDQLHANKPVEDIVKDFPETAPFIAELKKKLTKGKRSSTAHYTIEDLKPLGIDTDEFFNVSREIGNLIAAPLAEKKCSQKDYIRGTKALNGVVIAPEGSEAPEIPSWALNFDIAKTAHHQRHDEIAVIDENIKIYEKNFVEQGYFGLSGFNALLDFYGNILKVDLSTLKMDLKAIAKRTLEYNSLLQDTHTLLIDAPKGNAVMEKNRKLFTELFKPIDIEAVGPDPEKIAELQKELDFLPLEKCIDPKYFEPFFSETGVIVEK